jgi:hypothetical protein
MVLSLLSAWLASPGMADDRLCYGNPDRATSVLVQFGIGKVNGLFGPSGDVERWGLELNHPFTNWATFKLGYEIDNHTWSDYYQARSNFLDSQVFTVGLRVWIR